jgi:hypothetical protein
MRDRRMGRFSIPLRQIEDEPDKVIGLLYGVIVVEATTRWDSQSIEYLAISDKFEVVPLEREAPRYFIAEDRERLRFEKERFAVARVSE